MSLTTAQVPKELRYTEDKRKKAEETGKFVRVGGKQGTAYRKFASAPSFWTHKKTPDNDIYILPLRLSGPEPAVRQALAYNGATQAQIVDYLRGAVTRANFNVAEPVIRDQLARDEAIAGRVKAAPKIVRQAMYSADYLIQLVDRVKRKQFQVDHVDAPKRQFTSLRTPAKIKSIEERYHALKAGYILDVTLMGPDGSGIRSVKQPANKPRKFYIGGIPIISYDYDTYMIAFRRIFPDSGPDYIQRINNEWEQYKAAGGKRPAKATKKNTKGKSTSRSTKGKSTKGKSTKGKSTSRSTKGKSAVKSAVGSFAPVGLVPNFGLPPIASPSRTGLPPIASPSRLGRVSPSATSFNPVFGGMAPQMGSLGLGAISPMRNFA